LSLSLCLSLHSNNARRTSPYPYNKIARIVFSAIRLDKFEEKNPNRNVLLRNPPRPTYFFPPYAFLNFPFPSSNFFFLFFQIFSLPHSLLLSSLHNVRYIRTYTYVWETRFRYLIFLKTLWTNRSEQKNNNIKLIRHMPDSVGRKKIETDRSHDADKKLILGTATKARSVLENPSYE